MKIQTLSSYKTVLFLVGVALWTVVGPTVAILGTISSTGHNWSFFQAYAWLGGQRPSLVDALAMAQVTATYWLGTASSLVGFFTFLGSTLAIFNGRKTSVFWFGLIILGLASVALFSALWYTMLVAQPGGLTYYWKFLVPPTVGSIVFMFIGLYMMRSGVKKEEGRKIQLLSQ